MSDISYYDMNFYKRQVFDRAYVKFLFVGNILNDKALEIS